LPLIIKLLPDVKLSHCAKFEGHWSNSSQVISFMTFTSLLTSGTSYALPMCQNGRHISQIVPKL